MDSRSREAVIAEEYIRVNGVKHQLQDKATMAAVLKLCEKANDKPYEIPQIKMVGAEELAEYSHDIQLEFKKRIIYGVETFLVNYKENNASDVTVIYFHGGGYVFQAQYEHLAFVDKMALETDCKVFFPVYPLAPKYTYEESYRAVLAQYQSILKTTDPASIIFMGDSAGGGMALGLAKRLRDAGLPMPAQLILISPWMDVRNNHPEIEARGLEEVDPMLTGNYAMAGAAWAAGLPLDDPRVSTMYGNLKDLPPITLYIGTRDMLWPDAEKFRGLAAEQGVEIDYREWPGMNHCFCIYPIPEALQAQKEIFAMVDELDRTLKNKT